MGDKKHIRFLNSIIPSIIYDFQNKEGNIKNEILYMLDRTQSMFRYDGLPDTIPEKILECFLQVFGHVCFYEYNNNLYVFRGALGGEPDVYYKPTICTIANPALNLDANLKIDDECIIMYNDSLDIGLIPLFTKHATAQVETDLSIDLAKINTRIFNLVSAPDDRTKTSAEKYFNDVRAGKIGVIAENEFLNGIRSQPYANSNGHGIITDLIELKQYEKASWYNDIGLNANYNMKRESLNSNESQLNRDALLPLVDDMLKQRKIALDEINKKYNTNITVSLNSSWLDIQYEVSNQNDISGQPEGGEDNENNETIDRGNPELE